jgi:hypothetical protein
MPAARAGIRAGTYVLSLAAVVSAVLAPVLLARFALTMADSGGQSVIVNWRLQVPPPTGAVGWLALAFALLGWCWAVSAAVLVTGGAGQGRWTSVRTTLADSLRRLPTVLWTVLLAAVVLAVSRFAVLYAPGGGTTAVLIGLLVAVLVLVAVTWLAVVIPAALLSGAQGSGAFAAAYAVVRRRLRPGLAVLFALAGVPLVLLVPAGWVRDHLPGRAEHPAGTMVTIAAAELTWTIALIAVVACQGAMLARIYLRWSTAPVAPSGATPDAPPDATTTHTHRPRRALAVALAVMLPAAAVGAVTLTNPYGAPIVASDSLGGERRSVAAGWGEHGHPVLVSLGRTIEWCLDDRCREVHHTRTPVLVYSDPSTASVGADGSVLATWFEPPRHVQVARCTYDGGCVTSEIPWPGAGSPSAAYTAADIGPDGELLVATAWETAAGGDDPDGSDPAETDPDDRPRGVELILARCGDPACADPLVVEFGTVEASLPEADHILGHWPDGAVTRQQRREDTLQVSVDEHGAPMMTFRDAASGAHWVGTCESVACAAPDLTMATYAGLSPETDVLALAPVAGGLFVVAAESSPPEELLFLIGRVPERWRLSVRHCAEPSCASARTFAAVDNVGPGRYDVHLAARDDGAVLVVVGDSGDYRLLTWSR